MNSKSHVVAALLAGSVLAYGLQPAQAANAANGWESAAGNQNEMVFVATGDSIRLSTISLPGVDKMFDVIRRADVAFTNFETQIHDFTMAGAQQSGGTYMGSPRFVTDELAWAGFDLLGLANNHVNEYGVDGMRSTVAALSQTKFVQSPWDSGNPASSAASHIPRRKWMLRRSSRTWKSSARRLELPCGTGRVSAPCPGTNSW
jgi:poly-gamma-glutamate synthesis protein (capsule biosynthesis protein)